MEFYEKQGRTALLAARTDFGSNSFPINVSAPYREMERRITCLVKSIKGTPRVLDLCCGTGIHSIYPALLGCDVYGLDISTSSIQAAERLAQHHNVSDRCTFTVSDVSKRIAFETGFFDIVVCSGSLYYLNLKATVGEIVRVLKPGGQFFCIETFADNSLMRLWRRIRYSVKGDRDRQTMYYLLGQNDIQFILNQFHQSRVWYYDFFTLMSVLLKSNRALTDACYRLARRLDAKLLNGGLNMFAFKFFICGEKE